MKKGLLLLTGIFTLIGMGAGCTAPQENKKNEQSTLEARTEGNGPWDGSLVIATSEDGMTFTREETLLSRAGVPNLLRTEDETLILTFQYFSETDPNAFDVIAYMTSKNNGETWSDMNTITFTNLPEALDEEKKPMDPTLVQTSEGTLRLYFTYHAKGTEKAALYSAQSASIEEEFIVNPTPALALEDETLLDPAIVFFNGSWEHYTWKDKSDENFHSNSTDGETFTRQEDISLPMDFLGQVITTENGLRFYGTGKNGIVSAHSTDGATWTMDEGTRMQQGADPGIAVLSDGSYLMIFTSMNFNK